MSTVQQYAPSYHIELPGATLRHGSTADVLSVSVTETVNQSDTFAITLRDSYPTPSRLFAGGEKLTWMDSDVLKEKGKITIHMGYVNDEHMMLKGKINGIQSNFPSSGQPTVQIQGFSLYNELQNQRRREPFESATDSGIAKEIASAMGLSAKVDKTEAEHPLYSPKGNTFAAILEERAKRIAYEVCVKGDTLFFQEPAYLKNPGAEFTFTWGRDLSSFQPRVTTQGLPTETKVRASQTTQGRGKKPLVGQAKAGQERVKLGKETGTQIVKKSGKPNVVLITDHDVVTQQEANKVALSRLEEQSMGFIVATGAVIGEPKLRSRMVIELVDLGRRFSGKYYVTSTTHTIDSSGYRTSFKVKRNARN